MKWIKKLRDDPKLNYMLLTVLAPCFIGGIVWLLFGAKPGAVTAFVLFCLFMLAPPPSE